MSCYYQSARDMLVLSCDICKYKVDLYKGISDRTWKHDWMRENGWKTTKQNEKWIDVCPQCREAVRAARREKWAREQLGKENAQ